MKIINKIIFKIWCKWRIRFFGEWQYKFVFFTFYYLGSFFINKNKIYVEDIFSNIISSSYGHITAEIDFILRAKSKSKGKINILIWPTENAKILSNLLPKNKILLSDNFLKFILFSFLIGSKYYRDVSASLSIINYNKTPFHLVGYSDYKLHDYKKFKYIWHHFLLISEKKNLKGLHFFLNKKLKNPIKYKYAVLQIKDVLVNASAIVTDVNSYLLSIKYLQSIGLKVLFGGSEDMPEIFEEFDVIDYKKIVKQNYLNELVLINNAEVVITSGSGYAYLASALNKKLLYCNQWSIRIPQPGENTLQVPCRIKKKNKLLSLNEQYEYMDLQRANTNHLNIYSFVHPSGETILSSLKELLTQNRGAFENNKVVVKFRKKYHSFFGNLISRPSIASLLDFDN